MNLTKEIRERIETDCKEVIASVRKENLETAVRLFLSLEEYTAVSFTEIMSSKKLTNGEKSNFFARVSYFKITNSHWDK